jgi:hypothetical protein
VLSSASVPINFDYQWIPLAYDYHDASNNHLPNAAATADAAVDLKRFRPFWDGGIMSNTPLKELLQSHRTFWTNEIGNQVLKNNIWAIPRKIKHGPLNQRQDLVPNLDVYMINVWPNQIDGKYLPRDYDLTQARQNNITFGDKTKNDQLTAEIMTDYVSLVKRVREEALKNASTDKEKLDETFNNILNEFTNPNRVGQSLVLHEKMMDLMLGAFDVEKVLRVERGADKDSIFNMMLDFSDETIKMMMARGRHDALMHLIGHSIELITRFYSKEKERLVSLLEQAQEKIMDNYDGLHYNEALALVKEYVRERDLYLQRLEEPAKEEEKLYTWRKAARHLLRQR